MPGRELFHRIDAEAMILQNRLKTYDDIISGKNCIVCTSEALLTGQCLLSLHQWSGSFQLEKPFIDEIKEYFIRAGYERIGMVEGKGQFSQEEKNDFFLPYIRTQ